MNLRKFGLFTALSAVLSFSVACEDSDGGEDAGVQPTPDAGVVAPPALELLVDPVPAALEISEGDSVTYEISLNRVPDTAVEVSVTAGDTDALTITGEAVTFNADNFGTPHVVTITANEDDDAEDATVTVTVNATGFDAQAFEVSVRDNDTLAFDLPSTPLALTEGETATVSFALTAKPVGSVNVTVTATTAGGTVSASPNSMVFNADNWNQAQNVVVTAAQDIDVGDDSGFITFEGSGPSASISSSQLAVTVADDDVLSVQVNTSSVALDEGTSVSVAVQLDYQPVQDVTITLASSDSDTATTTPSSIVFTAQNYNVAQSVQINAVQDVNVVDNSAAITLTGTDVTTASISVDVRDDDTQALWTNVPTLRVTEGQTGVLGVRLEWQPQSDVTITVTSSNASSLTLSQETFTFTPANYGRPQVLDLAAQEDMDLVDGLVNVVVSSPGLPSVVVPVTIRDDDTQTLIVDQTSFNLIEGNSATVNVSLMFEPTFNETVTLTSADPAVATTLPAQLVFTAGNYNVPQPVVINAEHDVNLNDAATDITVSAPTAPVSITLNVAVTDEDSLATALSVAQVSVVEGSTAAVDVTLAYQPNNDINLFISSSDVDAVRTNLPQLVFTPSTWNIPQRVVLTGVNDIDVSDETANITFAGAGVPTILLPVGVTDDDEQAIVSNATGLAVNEEASGTFGVSLAFQPAGNVTVTVTSSDATIATASPQILTFTPANYSQPQNVSVSGTSDTDVADESTAIVLTSAALAPITVPVTVLDDDSVSISANQTSVNIAENGVATLDVLLTFAPSAPLTVTLASSDPGIIGLTPAALTFDASNYNVAQTITINANDDTNTVDETVNLTLSSAGLPDLVVALNVADDDTQTIVVDSQAVTVVEGANAPVGVALQFEPSSPVTVFVTTSDPAVGTVNPSVLTFTPANYLTPQTVTVRGTQDDDVVAQNATLSFTSAGIATVSIPLTVNDDDTQNIIAVPASVTVNENANASVNVRLAFRPAGDVTVAVVSNDTNAATVGPQSLVFNASNFNVPQAFTVSGQDDQDIADNLTTITLSAGGVADRIVNVTVVDDDVMNLAVTPTSLNLAIGTNGQFGIELTQQPTNPITVAVASNDASVATVNPATLTFTAANWNQPQNVEVTPVADADTLDDSTTITISSAGLTSRTVTVDVADPDVQAILVSNNTLSFDEQGSATFDVSLAFDPVNPITVTVISNDNGAATVNPGAVNFTSGDYAQGQTITVSGVEDIDQTDENLTLVLSSPGLPNETVNVTVTDQTQQTIIASQTAINVDEGESVTLRVSLSAQPPADVTVTLTSNDPGAVTAAPAQLVFTPANFAVEQLATITGAADEDTVNEAGNVTLSATGVPDVVIGVSVDDDDIQDLVIDRTTVSPAEGGSDVFNVSLAFDPVTDLVVSIGSSDPGRVNGDPNSITFTSANYTIPQAVTVNAEQDLDTEDDTAVLTISSAATVDEQVDVEIADDDDQALVLSATEVTVLEGQTTTVDVSLAFDPLGSVSITVVSGDTSVASVTPATLTFDSNNYNVGQAITIAGEQDNDNADDVATITVVGSVAPNVQITANVTDEDVQAFVLNSNAFNLTEGIDGTLAVNLAFNPQADVQVTVATTDIGAVEPTPAVLTFTEANYAVPQNVTLRTVQDLDINDETGIQITVSSPVTPDAVATVNVADDDTQSIILTPAAINLAEGGNAVQLFATLAFDPVGTATVTLVSSDLGAVDLDQGALVFDSTNFATPQSVNVIPVDDADIVDESVIITASSPITTDTTVGVTVTDDDVPTLVVSQTAFAFAEGTQSTFDVALSFDPLGTVRVNLVSSDDEAVAVTPPFLDFDSSNFDQVQQVTLNAVQDLDVVDENVTVTVVGVSGAPNVVATVDVVDDDTQAIVVDSNALTVAEDANTTLFVQLAFDPVNATSVTIVSSDAGAAAVSPVTLNFDSTNYDVPQAVTVSGSDDDDTEDENVTLTLSSLVAPNEVVTVAVTDPDTQGIITNAASFDINEGNQASLTVRLAFNPVTPTAVTITSDDLGAVSASPVLLNFDATNFAIPQTVLLEGVNDNDTQDEPAVNVTLAGANAPDINVAVNVTDDDVQALVLNRTTINVGEGGTDTFTVSLAFDPVNDLDVNVASSNPGLVGLSATDLTFTSGNYQQGQLITVTAGQDPDTADDTETITVDSPETAAVNVTVDIADDDTQALVVSDTNVTFAEGANQVVGLSLAFDPLADVSVTIVSDDTGAVTLTPATLIFTSANYDQIQNVTLVGVQDADISDEVVIVTAVNGVAPNVEITANVQDDDVQALVVNANNFTIDEGGTATLEVNLAFNPLANVDVSIVSDDPDAVSVAPATLTFGPSNFGVPQNVTLTGAQDMDVLDELGVSIAVTSSATAPVGVTVDVTDEDVQALVINPTAMQIDEGAALPAQLEVALAFDPSGTATVSLQSSDIGAVGLSVSDLIFDSSNFDTPQLVDVTGLDDADVSDETATITISSTSTAATRTVAVSVNDDDTPGLVIDQTALNLNEGDTPTVNISLDFDPQGPVTVNLASSDAGAVDVLPASLNFDENNYMNPQSVTVTAVEDGDIIDENAILTVSGVGGAPDRQITVAVTDNDTQSIVVSTAQVVVDEDLTTVFEVSLSADPVSPTSVFIASSDAGAASVSPATVNFDSANWNVPQQITVTGVDDDDTADENVTLTLSSVIAPNVTVSVDVNDPDTQALVTNAVSFDIDEQGVATLTVRLAFNPVNQTTVTIASADPGAVGTNPTTLVFDANNYAASQAVSISGIEDDDVSNELGVGLTLSGANAPDVNVTVNVTDDDTQAIVLSDTAVTVAEGASVDVNARLAFNPEGPVTVNVASANTAIATVGVATIDFDETNWNQNRIVAITGVQDADVANENTVINFTGGGAAAGAATTVQVTDDDVMAIQTQNLPTTVSEDGTVTFQVRLSNRPEASTSINLQSDDTDAATITGPLNFDTTNWNTFQTVTISGVQDDDLLDEVVNFTLSSPVVDTANNVVFAIDVTDTDTQAIVTNTQTINTTEGLQIVYTVRLAFDPTNLLVVNLASSDPGAVSLDTSVLNFTSQNWNTPQNITLTAESDDDAQNESVTLAHTAAGIARVNIAVGVTEDDVQALVVSETAVTVVEEATETFTVAMAFNPITTATVTIVSSEPGAATTTPTTLFFDAGNWATPQTVTINGLGDADVADETLTLTISEAASADATIDLTVDDNDDQDIVVSATTLAVDEGSTVTFTVQLQQDPQGTATVNIANADPGAASLSETTLSFDSSDYNLPQQITVTGADDLDAGNETVTLTLTSAGIPDATVTVNVTDDEVQAVVATPDALTLTEGGADGSFVVTLAADPGSDLEISLSSDAGDALTLSQATVTLNDTNWNTGVTVNVTPEEDDDATNEVATITLTAPGATAEAVAATLTDNDTQAIVLNQAAMTVTEGDTESVGVTLAARPEANVEITATSNTLLAVLVDPQVLTFTPNNWNISQNFGIQGQQDLDLDNESTSVTFDTPNVAPVDLPVDVIDEDIQQVIITNAATALNEGGAGSTFDVRLAFIPTVGQGGTITITSADPQAVSLGVTTLTFTALDYTLAQQVAFAPVNDLDVRDESVVLTVADSQLQAGQTAVASTDVTVTVTDDDVQGYVITPTALSLTEEGVFDTFDVSLLFEPDGPTNITINSGDAGAVFVNTPGNTAAGSTTLTFDVGNYTTAQTVEVSAISDDDLVDEAVDVTITSTIVTTDGTVGVTVFDDDTQAIVTSGTSDLCTVANMIRLREINIGDDDHLIIQNIGPSTCSLDIAGLEIKIDDWLDSTTPERDFESAALTSNVLAGGETLALYESSSCPTSLSNCVNLNQRMWSAQGSGQTMTLHFAGNIIDTHAFRSETYFSPADTAPSYGFGGAFAPSDGQLYADSLNDNSACFTRTAFNLQGNVADWSIGACSNGTAGALPWNQWLEGITLAEGQSDTSLGVRLAFRPSAAVVVSVASLDPTIASRAPQTLTFQPAQFDQVQNVSITGASDLNQIDAFTDVILSANNVENATVAVAVIDDDTQTISPNVVATTLTEDGSVQISISLDFEPLDGTDEVITIASSDPAAATVNPTTLTFTTANHLAAQVVTITGVADQDLQNELVTLTISSDESGTPDATVTATVTDDDTQSYVLTNTPVTVVEGSGASSSFTLALAFEPLAASSVTVTSEDTGGALVGLTPAGPFAASASLNFTAGNYASGQDVYISAVDDDDLVDESVTVRVSSSIAADATTNVTVTDDDIQSYLVVGGPVAVTENASDGSFSVALAFRPAAPVTVSLTSNDPAVATVSPISMTFQPGTYDQAQSAVVTGTGDNNLTDASTTITLNSADVPTDVDVAVNVTDDDTQTIQLSATNVSVTEGGSTTFAVSLSFEPIDGVNELITIASADPGAVTITPTQLTFTAANFATGQTVTVNGVQDNDLSPENVALTLSSDESATGNATVQASVTEDDTQSHVLASAPVTVDEGQSGNFTVRLEFEPLSNVEVTVTSGDQDAAALAAVNGGPFNETTTLTFTPANYATPQDVFVSGVADDDLADETVFLTVSSSVAGDVITQATVTDDDTQAIVTSGLATNTCAVENVIRILEVNIGSDDHIIIQNAGPSSCTVDVAGLEVKFDDWRTGVSSVVATLASAQLAGGETRALFESSSCPSGLSNCANLGVNIPYFPNNGAGTTTLHFNGNVIDTHAYEAIQSGLTPSYEFGGAFNPTTGQVFDNATLDQNDDCFVRTAFQQTGNVSEWTIDDCSDGTRNGLSELVPGLGVTVAEGQSNTDLGVRLAFRPAAAVVVTLNSQDTNVATVSPATLTFEPSNFDTAQTVTITGTPDTNLVLNSTQLAIATSGVPSESVEIDVTDVDTQAIQLNVATVNSAENGNTTFTVSLAFEPIDGTDEIITITPADVGAVSVVNGSPLTFTTANYAAAQTVTLTGVDDLDTLDETVTVAVTSDESTTSPTSLTATVDDDDTQAIILSANSVTVDEEAGTATLDVRLQFDPTGTQTVQIASADIDAVTVSPNTMTFDSGNYDTNQTLTFTGVSDIDMADESVAVTFTALGINSVQATAQVTDDDAGQQAIIVTAPTNSFAEGADTTWTARLLYQPSALENVTINVTSGDTTIATVSPATMNFDSTNWNVNQDLVLSGQEDSNLDTNTTDITFVDTRDPLLNPEAAQPLVVTATVTDNDTQAIILSANSLSVGENSSGAITARLAFEPLAAATETISFVSADTGALTVTQALSFNGSNYATPQNVVFNGVADLDVLDELVTVAATSNVQGTPGQTVTATVTDDDTQGIIVTTANNLIPQVPEGQSATNNIFVRLAFDPTTSRTVEIVSTDTDLVTVSPSSLVFTSATYTSTQTITITGVNDLDMLNEVVELRFSSASVTTVPVNVQVNDEDTQELVVTPTTDPLQVNEGATQDLAVSLGYQPDAASGTVFVSLSENSGGNVITLAPAVLAFDSTNWNLPQTVTLTGIVDNDDLDDETATFVVSSPLNAGGNENPLPVSRSVTVIDDDSQSLIIGTVPDNLATSIQEAGPAGSILVRPGLPPAIADQGVLQVTLSTTDSNVVFNPSTLTFGITNYDTPQTVSITAAADTDTNDHALTVTVESATSISAPVSGTHPLRIIDRDNPVLAAAAVVGFTGASATTKRQNIRWGASRLAYTAYDSAGNTVVFSNNRELSSSIGPVTLGQTASGEAVESVEWDGSDFGAFAMTSAGVTYNRFSEDLTVENTTAIGSATATEIWPVYNEVNDSYGMVYKDSALEIFFFQEVSLAGVGGIQKITSFGNSSTEDFRPNLIHRGTAATSTSAFAQLYTESSQTGSERVVCRHLTASGDQSGAETNMVGFSSTGNVFTTMYRPENDRMYLAYYQATRGLVVATVRAHDCQVLNHTVIGAAPNLESPPPFIAFNGVQFAIAYDYEDTVTNSNEVGVALLDSDLTLVSDFVVGPGIRPSIEWATDRWALRYQADSNGDQAAVVVGSFYQ